MASNFPTWPPNVDAYVLLQAVPAGAVTRDTAVITANLASAVAFVERMHVGDFDFGLGESDEEDLPAVPADMVLGTIRLAARWMLRGRGPEANTANAATSGDVDIDRQLRIGSQRRGVVA